jgi:hypothetical protein
MVFVWVCWGWYVGLCFMHFVSCYLIVHGYILIVLITHRPCNLSQFCTSTHTNILNVNTCLQCLYRPSLCEWSYFNICIYVYDSREQQDENNGKFSILQHKHYLLCPVLLRQMSQRSVSQKLRETYVHLNCHESWFKLKLHHLPVMMILTRKLPSTLNFRLLEQKP